MKRLFAMLMAVVMAVGLLAACGPSELAPAEPGGPAPVHVTPAPAATPAPAPAAAPGAGEDVPLVRQESSRDIIHIQTASDPGDFSPTGSVAVPAMRLRRQIFEPLVDLNLSTGELMPVLAESWSLEDDTWTFNLRQGVTFHDGSPFTAYDAMYSLQLAESAATIRRFVESFDTENIRVVDRYTLEVPMSMPSIQALVDLNGVAMVNEALHTADPEMLIGTGSYMFHDWVLGSSITLIRFEDHWSGPAPIETVVFRIIPEPAQRIIELELGGVDLILDLAAIDVPRLQADPRFEVLPFLGFRSMGFQFNMHESRVTSNRDLRHAIAYAIEKEGINHAIFGNLAKPSVAPVGEMYIDFNPEWATWANNYFQFNLDNARAAMERSGVPQGTEIIIMSNDNPAWVSLAEILQAQLGQIGLNVRINIYESAVFEEHARNPQYNWDIQLRDQSNPVGMTISKMYSHFRSAGTNRSYFHNDEFDDLVTRGMVEADDAVRAEMADRLIEIMLDELPGYMIVQMSEPFAWHADLMNFSVWSRSHVLVEHLYFR